MQGNVDFSSMKKSLQFKTNGIYVQRKIRTCYQFDSKTIANAISSDIPTVPMLRYAYSKLGVSHTDSFRNN
jgi:hypothetical protein